MAKIRKRKTNPILKIFVLIFFIILVSVVCFFMVHPTYYKYNDLWIIGNTVENVKERYGDFDVITDVCVAYYIYTDNKGFLPDHLKHYYYMEYDQNGVIYKVHDSCQLGG